jgi:hypothetical protein
MNSKTPQGILHPSPVFWHERLQKTFEMKLTSTNTVDSTVKYYFLEYPYTFLRPYSLPSHLQIMYSFTAGLRSSGYPRKSGSMISVYEYIVRLLWAHTGTYQARANINNIFWNEEDQCIHFSRNRNSQFRCGESAQRQCTILVFSRVSVNTPFCRRSS